MSFLFLDTFSLSVKNLKNQNSTTEVLLRVLAGRWVGSFYCLIFAAVKTDNCRGKMSHLNFISAELRPSPRSSTPLLELSQTIFVLFLLIFEILSLLTDRILVQAVVQAVQTWG